jgi:hypothetical protein
MLCNCSKSNEPVIKRELTYQKKETDKPIQHKPKTPSPASKKKIITINFFDVRDKKIDSLEITIRDEEGATMNVNSLKELIPKDAYNITKAEFRNNEYHRCPLTQEPIRIKDIYEIELTCTTTITIPIDYLGENFEKIGETSIEIKGANKETTININYFKETISKDKYNIVRAYYWKDGVGHDLKEKPIHLYEIDKIELVCYEQSNHSSTPNSGIEPAQDTDVARLMQNKTCSQLEWLELIIRIWAKGKLGQVPDNFQDEIYNDIMDFIIQDEYQDNDIFQLGIQAIKVLGRFKNKRKIIAKECAKRDLDLTAILAEHPLISLYNVKQHEIDAFLCFQHSLKNT